MRQTMVNSAAPARRGRRAAITTLAMLAVPAVLISGCGSKATPSAQPASTATAAASTGDSATPAPNATANVGAPEALQFKASLVGGGELDATTLANGQPVLFWFWSPF